MRIEILIIAATAFFVANTYKDGLYVAKLKSWKKYYQMIGIAFVGISSYAYIKKYPEIPRILQSAKCVLRYIPIDWDAGDYLTPLLNMASGSQNVVSMSAKLNPLDYDKTMFYMPQQKRMMSSGGKTTKRSVSETKKKYVAAQQD